MIPKEKADLRLNCLYAAVSILGVNSSGLSLTKGEKESRPRSQPTTQDVLNEAEKLWGWVSKKGDDK